MRNVDDRCLSRYGGLDVESFFVPEKNCRALATTAIPRTGLKYEQLFEEYAVNKKRETTLMYFPNAHYDSRYTNIICRVL